MPPASGRTGQRGIKSASGIKPSRAGAMPRSRATEYRQVSAKWVKTWRTMPTLLPVRHRPNGSHFRPSQPLEGKASVPPKPLSGPGLDQPALPAEADQTCPAAGVWAFRRLAGRSAAMPCARAAQSSISGQMPQAGLRGCRSSRPDPSSPGEIARPARAASAVSSATSSGLAAGRVSGPRKSRATTVRHLPSTTVSRRGQNDGGDGGRGIGPMPGRAASPRACRETRPWRRPRGCRRSGCGRGRNSQAPPIRP